MKNYQEVIEDRFNIEEDNSNSVYAPNHPIGKYVRRTLFNGLDKFLSKYYNTQQGLNTKKLLDVGCGNGGMLSFFISRGFSPKNTVGIDLSETRINTASKQSQGETYVRADVLTFNLNEQKFDLITSFDLFSHLNTKEQIIKGLDNIHKHLEDDGLFLWYDLYSKDHFAPPAKVDSWGFNKEQMISLSKESGFDVVYYKPFFKRYFNRFHSVYQVQRLSPIIVKSLEVVLPGMPGNSLIVFKKSQLS